MAHMKTLPNEILLDVFERLQHCPSSLLNVMLCCHKWHQLASSVLYAHVALDSKLREDSPTSRFAQNATQCDLVRSLSLRVTQVHLMGFGIQSIEAFDRLTELSGVLSRMENLTTFSLSFEEPVGQGFPVPSAAIVPMLNALPNTLVNLNLDCDNLKTPALQQTHVCHALSALLPRLKSFRLRASHICSGLLGGLTNQATFDHERNLPSRATTRIKATSSLEHFVIRLDTRPESEHGTHTCLCYSGGKLLHGSRMAEMFQRLYEQGALPYLRRFAIIGRVDAPPSPRNDHWSVLKVREWARDSIRTTTFPWCPRGGSSSLFMIRDGDGDWFGSFNDISSSVEGPLVWTKIGIKPADSSVKSCTWKLDHTNLASRATVTQKFGVSFRLWKHEDATGMKLLQVRTATGFDDMATMSQLVPDGWRWVPGGPWQWTIQPIAA